MANIEFLNVVACDEVRQEASGRVILIGVAPIGPELLNRTDGRFGLQRLSFYMEIKVSGVTALSFRLLNPQSSAVSFESEMRLDRSLTDDDNNDNNDVSLGTIVLNLQDPIFDAEGSYLLQYKLPDGEWSDIREFIFVSPETATVSNG